MVSISALLSMRGFILGTSVVGALEQGQVVCGDMKDWRRAGKTQNVENIINAVITL